MSTEAELQRQNERLELLLNLTSKITSSLEIRGGCGSLKMFSDR
jgi:hypothetical protein